MSDSRVTGMQGRRMGLLGFTLALCVVLCPSILVISSFGFSFEAALWAFISRPWATGFSVRAPQDWFGPLLFIITIPQATFAAFAFRVYQNKTSPTRAFQVGLLTFLPLIIFDVINALPKLWDPNYPYGFDSFPFPLLMLIVLVMVKLVPPLEFSSAATPESWLSEKPNQDGTTVRGPE